MAEDANTSPAAGEIPTGRAKNRPGAPAMTWAEKALRDSAIVAALHAGEPVKDIGKRYGITPRSVRRIFEAFGERPTALEQRPMEIIERVLRTYEQQMRDFMLVAQTTLERAPAVAVGALKGHADSLERYTMLLSDVGKLPDNLELFRSETEMRRVGELMVERLQALAAGETDAMAVKELFERLVLGPQWDAVGEAHELPPGDENGDDSSEPAN